MSVKSKEFAQYASAIGFSCNWGKLHTPVKLFIQHREAILCDDTEMVSMKKKIIHLLFATHLDRNDIKNLFSRNNAC